jgi:glycosyltransferase involved in cell wall biosynthesis
MNQKKNKLKILYLAAWYPNKYDPMPGLFIQRHAEAVSKYCNVAVLYVHPDPCLTEIKYYNEISEENSLFTVRIYFKQVSSNYFLISNILKGFRYLKSNFIGFKYILRTFGKPDLVHVNVLTRAGVIALIIKLLKGIPYLISEHWSRYLTGVGNYSGFVRLLLTKIVVRKASAVITVTDDLRKAMINQGLRNQNYMIIPNVVDVNMFKPKEYGNVRTKKVFAHISCFDDKAKNISGIIRTIKQLSALRDDFECHLVGDGIDRQDLEKYADELNINNRFVFFTGLKTGMDLFETYDVSDFTLLFSNYENLPVVILESFACGLPVISSDVGGISEYFSSNYGILVKPGNENDLLKAINYMLDNYEKYDRKKIRNYAISNFSYEVVSHKLYRIYNQIVALE